MEAKELRIGNYVHHNKGWSYRCGGRDFDFIWNESDWYALGECTLDLSNIKPIPLTEEWLVKFGFKHFADGQYEKIFENLDFNWDKECGLYIFLRTREDCIEASHIKHVHQLQNLYFALTNKELTIK